MIQNTLNSGPNRSQGWKRDKLFNGMIKCGHCGLSVCGENKVKGNKNNKTVRRYTYYRCTHFKQRCPDPYVEEKKLLDLFENAVSNIHVGDELFDRIKDYLLKAHQARSTQYKSDKPVLQRKINELEEMRDKAYEDKLKGVISEGFFTKRNNCWTEEITLLNEDLNDLKSTNKELYQRSVLNFELANQARNLYKKQNPDKQVKFLKLLLSNSLLKDGILQFEFKKTFDLVLNMKNTPNESDWWAHKDLNLGPIGYEPSALTN